MIFKKYKLKNAHSGVVEAYLYVPGDESKQSILFDFRKGFEEVNTPEFVGIDYNTLYSPTKIILKYMDYNIEFYKNINIQNEPELFHFLYKDNIKFRIEFYSINNTRTHCNLYEVDDSYYICMMDRMIEVEVESIRLETVWAGTMCSAPVYSSYTTLRWGSFSLEARIVKEINNYEEI